MCIWVLNSLQWGKGCIRHTMIMTLIKFSWSISGKNYCHWSPLLWDLRSLAIMQHQESLNGGFFAFFLLHGTHTFFLVYIHVSRIDRHLFSGLPYTQTPKPLNVVSNLNPHLITACLHWVLEAQVRGTRGPICHLKGLQPENSCVCYFCFDLF